MKRTALALSLIALSTPHLAAAHGGTRQKHCEQIAIAAPPAAVWALAGDFAHPEKWLPAVESATAQGQGDKGDVRALRLRKGGVLQEKVLSAGPVDLNRKSRFPDPLDPAVLPANTFTVILDVKPNPGGGSLTTLKAAYYRWFTPNNPPPGQDEKAANTAVAELFRGGLAQLKALAEGRESTSGEVPATIVDCKVLAEASTKAAATPEANTMEEKTPSESAADPRAPASDQSRYPLADSRQKAQCGNAGEGAESAKHDARYPAAYFSAEVLYRNPEYFGETRVP